MPVHALDTHDVEVVRKAGLQKCRHTIVTLISQVPVPTENLIRAGMSDWIG
jgi:hypothetical protein